MPCLNNLIRKGMSILLIIALNVTGLFSCHNTAYADTVILSEQVYYHLDMGVQIAYNHGCDWGSTNIYGSSTPIDVNTTITFNYEVEVLDSYPLSSAKGNSFDFNGDGNSHNIPSSLGAGDSAYDIFYKNHVSTFMTEGNCSSNGKRVSFNYTARINTAEPLEVVAYGEDRRDGEIYQLFGGKTALEADQPEIAEAIATALEAGRNGTAGNNKLYLIFCPNVIEYRKYIEVGDLEARLDLPSTAKQGETYSVADASIVDSSLTVEKALLEKQIGSGIWEETAVWWGTGTPGKNTGGSVEESCDEIGTVTYRLTVTATNGQQDTDMKTIMITDGREIDGQAILELPEYTYEGHPALARDVSVFQVDGKSYSARRAYEENVADNDFIPMPASAGSATRETLTTANVVFERRGNYKVKLEVNTANGTTLTDIKPITVRKTPYILDSLGGFQKQNRRQILNLSVATYPGKPIVDYSIKLKDLKTGQEVILTEAEPLQNNATIKTRAVTSEGDSYWINFELLFLTKNTEAQLYQYTVFMKDSKGDTDTVQKTFTVAPDLPPDPAIIMQDSFIRNKGTNYAEIISEDASTTDGDQLERTWSVEGKDVKTMEGYKDLAFGTGQKVQFNKSGVGKMDVDLFLKDVWIEPTLEEYVTDADRKTAATTKTADVLNIAPTVRLEPIATKEAELVIVTDRKHKTAVSEGINTLKAALIEKGFDPHISLAVSADADEGGYRRVASWTWDTTVNCGMCNRNSGQMDSEYVYRIVSPGKYVDGYQERCVTDQPHVVQALSAGTTEASGYIAWSYPVNESRSFGIELDNKEKYVYIVCYDTNKTTVLNRDNGAYLTTLNMAIPGAPFLNDDGQKLYFVANSGITKYDTSSGTYSTVISRGGQLAQMMDGKIIFVGKKEPPVKQNKNGFGFYIGRFDMDSETIEEVAVPELPNTGGPVSPADIDAEGKVLLKQGSNIWVADTQNQTVKMTNGAGIGDHMNSTVFVKNEKGEGVYTAHAYNNTDYKAISYFYFMLYDFSGSELVGVAGFGSSKYSGYNWNGLSYAKLHSGENMIYIMQGNQFQSGDWGGSVQGFLFRIHVPTMGIDRSYSAWHWDVADESGAYSGSLMRTFYALDRWMSMEDRINLFRNSITEQDAKIYALRKNAASSNSDAEKYVVIAGEETAEQILNDPVFRDEIDLRGAASLFYNVKDAIGTIADRIEELGVGLKNLLLLEGGGTQGNASLEHEIQLLPDTEYEYQYDVITTGKAIDLFQIKNANSRGLENDGKYFERAAAFINFNSGLSEPFFTMSGGGTGSWDGYGTYADTYGNTAFSASFEMEKDGYVTFDLHIEGTGYKSHTNTLTYYVDGKQVGGDGITGYTALNAPRTIYLSKGAHTIYFLHSCSGVFLSAASINNLKAVYYEDTADAFMPAAISPSDSGEMQTVSNSFRVGGEEGMAVVTEISNTMTTKTESEYSQYISSSSYSMRELWDSINRKYYWATTQGPPFSFDETTGVYSIVGGYERGYPSFTIKAPPDKFLIYSYNVSFSGGRNNKDTSQPGERLYPGTEVRILRPGQAQTLSAELYYYDKGAQENRSAKMYIYNIRIAEFDAESFGGVSNLQNITVSVKDKSIKGLAGDNLLIQIDEATGSVTVKLLADLAGSESPLNNGIRLSTSESAETISALVSNFRLYQKLGGVRQLIFSQNFNSLNALDLTGWSLSASGGGKAEIVSVKPPQKEKEEPLIYKKGQLVSYNIFYDDYESDPSQKLFWRYAHTPYNDGSHPQAAFILDEDGGVISSTGAILPESIPRFYIDGKYTVEHWQLDNTNRTGDTSGKTDYSKYDKLSNVESLTFYIEGGAEAPWITFIKTIPGTVKEGNEYQLQIGVDDAEKDELRLTTELYQDKKLIYTHKQSNLAADANGVYPTVTTGSPPAAEPGRYEAVCTVRDQTGAGIGSYRFTVISEGKVTGFVNHTDQWDRNRKKYNLKRFSEEVNRPLQLSDYRALPAPRKRGTNVFWSGEKFMLRAETEGNPSKVEVQIMTLSDQGTAKSTGYFAELSSTGRKKGEGDEIWEGSLWDKSMINKWGRKAPEQLLFVFTASYSGGTSKTHEAVVIVDSQRDYWQLHRLW